MSRPLTPTIGLDAESVQRLTRRIDQACELMGRLSGSSIAATEFYQTLVSKTLSVMAGSAGAIWLKTPQGLPQPMHQMNVGDIGLDETLDGRELRIQLLRHAFTVKQFFNLDPGSRFTTCHGTEGGNASNHPLLLAPILDEQGGVTGLFEVWLDPDGDRKLRTLYANFVNNMAGFAANYLRNTSALRNTLQEQVFTQIETFSRQIHGSLNPTEVAFHIVNEGRRLVGCDRLSAGIRHGRRTKIEAVSGSDLVERSSVQVKAMAALFDAVLEWNEKLVYQGNRDATLPPKVLAALDTYLTFSNPKFLVLQPLRDEREQKKDKEKVAKPHPARSALLLESFDPPELVDPMLDRFNLVAGHSASALFNASEMKRIPFAFLWRPVQALQGHAGGKTRFYTILAVLALVALTLVLVFVPYPLKFDSKGQLEPKEWNYIYSPEPGRVVQFKVKPGDVIKPNTPIAVMADNELATKIGDKVSEITKTRKEVDALGGGDNMMTPAEKQKKRDEMEIKRETLNELTKQLDLLIKQRNADRDNPGQFTVYAPAFHRSRDSKKPAEWQVVSSEFLHQLVNRWVKSADPLLRVGNTAAAWQIEMKIPQKHISQLLRAYKTKEPNEFLEVDVLLTSRPTTTYKGRLYRRDISAEAVQNKDDHNESEFIVYAYVRVNDPDMPAEDHIPIDDLTTGLEVHTKIRCGTHSLGYCLFHGAWEFLYEHVVFAF